MFKRRKSVEHLEMGVPRDVNPDRVKVREETRTYAEVREGVEYVDVHHAPTWALTLGNFKNRLWLFTKLGLASLAITTVGANLGTERETPKTESTDTQKPETEDFLVGLNDTLERVVNVEFVERFSSLNEAGERVFNPGALLLPVSVGVTSEKNIEVVVELSIPYDWARTFKEVQKTDPARAEELKQELVTKLREQVKSQVVIRGLNGATNSTAVWNAHDKTLAIADDGSIVPPESLNLSVESISVTGTASDEARIKGAQSLGAEDEQNAELAEGRAQDLEPLIRSALTEAGFSIDAIEDIEFQGIEQYLTQNELEKIANIGSTLPSFARMGGTIEERAIRLINAYNDGQDVGLTDDDSSFLHGVLNEKRRVDVVVKASGTEKKFESYNIGFFLPLLGLLAFGVRRVPRKVTSMPQRYLEDVTVVEVTRKAVARRIFSETTPHELQKERDFHEIYDNINLGADGRYEDFQNMQRHMLQEEVFPAWRGDHEPFIDYFAVANESFRYMYSDTPEYGVRKGRYPTSAEATRFITEKIVEMWEQHDQATYPMDGIDIKTVLNYRHSESVVTYAKILAETFVSISERLYKQGEGALQGNAGRTPIVTQQEFQDELLGLLIESRSNPELWRNRNLFVISQLKSER